MLRRVRLTDHFGWHTRHTRPVGHVADHGGPSTHHSVRTNAYSGAHRHPDTDQAPWANVDASAEVRSWADVAAGAEMTVVIDACGSVDDDVTAELDPGLDHYTCKNHGPGANRHAGVHYSAWVNQADPVCGHAGREGMARAVVADGDDRVPAREVRNRPADGDFQDFFAYLFRTVVVGSSHPVPNGLGRGHDHGCMSPGAEY